MEIPLETVNKILGYLGGRPYAEVTELIQLIGQAGEAQAKKEKDKKK